ncbi:TPA: restriction endonuclease subunit S [Staphylococcus aureus]|nr:restriction endonuclease subunit S [Staphylococcus aureus]HCW0039032.1 restriction endonuclease subunit S [Staphylococcus aureus]
MEFKKYKIEEIGTVVGGGTPSTKNDNYYGGNISWITPKDLSNYSNRYIYHGERNITEEGLNNSSAKLVPTDTILMTSRAPIGYLALAGKKVATNQGFKSIICNEEIVSPKYLYYLLQNKMDNIKSLGTGSTFSEISGKVVKNIEVSLPNLLNQKRVEKVLDSIDEKIELNQKIIANLEELSQTLFKRWFVDFEFPDENGNPYKSSGGEMVDSELRMIPKGWEILELGKITEIIMGQSPKSDTYNTQNEGLPLLNGAADFKNRNLKATKYTTDPKKRGQIGDYVFGVRATVGLVTELDRDYAIGRGAAVARIESTYKEWLYEILVKSFQYFENSISGSVYINISSNDLKNYKVIYPSTEIIHKYHEKLVSIFDLVKSVKLEIKHLTQLRDTLLPKLMSGEIEIPDDIEVNEDELSI